MLPCRLRQDVGDGGCPILLIMEVLHHLTSRLPYHGSPVRSFNVHIYERDRGGAGSVVSTVRPSLFHFFTALKETKQVARAVDPTTIASNPKGVASLIAESAALRYIRLKRVLRACSSIVKDLKGQYFRCSFYGWPFIQPLRLQFLLVRFPFAIPAQLPVLRPPKAQTCGSVWDLGRLSVRQDVIYTS